MKKASLNLTALTIGALSLLATSGLVTSCYDDSFLKDEISRIDGDVQSIDTRLKALETKVNNDISSVTALILACQESEKTLQANIDDLNKATGDKFTSLEQLIGDKYDALQNTVNTKFEEAKNLIKILNVEIDANGKYVVTLNDNKHTKIVVEPANNNQLVTIVDQKWAVIDAKGNVQSLDVPVLHPDFKIQLNPNTNTVEYSVNGGADWIKTNITIPEVGPNPIFTDVKDNGETVTLCAGNQTFTVMKQTTSRFDIQAGKSFFALGESRTIPVDVKGIKTTWISKCPKGWSAEHVGKGLTITAPSVLEGNDAEGQVELWCVTESGLTLIGEVFVSTKPAYATVTIQEDSVLFDFVSDELTSFFAYGMTPASEWNPDELFDYVNMNMGAYDVPNVHDLPLNDNWEPICNFKTSIEDIYGQPLTKGEQYIIWAYECASEFVPDSWRPKVISTPNDFIKVFYTPYSVDLTSEPSWNEVNLNLTVQGLDKYYGLVMSKEDYDMYYEMWEPANLESMGQTFFQAFDVNQSGSWLTGNYTGPLSTFGIADLELGMKTDIQPGVEYVICVLPYDNVKNEADYIREDLITFNVQAKPLVFNASCPEVTVSNLVAKYDRADAVLSANGAEKILWTCMPEAEWNSIVDDAETYFINNYSELNVSLDGEDISMTYLKAGAPYVLVSVALSSDGSIGMATQTNFSTLGLTYVDNVTVSSVKVELVQGKHVATVTVDGPATQIAWCVINKPTPTDDQLINLLKNLPGQHYSWNFAKLENGAKSITITDKLYKYYSGNYYLVAVAVNADNQISHYVVSEPYSKPV